MARTQDIEDVLSAIRRLVTNDAPAERTVPTAPTLLLSQAQRINGPEDPFQTIRSHGQPERGAVEPTASPTGNPQQALPGRTATNDATVGQTEPPIGPFETSDLWTRAVDAIDLPLDYAEDTDFEEAESRSLGDTMAPDPAEAAHPDRTRIEAEEVIEAEEAIVPLILNDMTKDLVDDDQLRDIIADVVRQELSGELGERITRNVRKLVRREIRQMLASGDLD